ncbi:MAG TPA: type II secretion system protein GspC [Polyangiaceae bacterium]|jgi:general secretion pathway protein C
MAVDQVLKKNFWAVLAPLVGVIAFLNAEGIMQLVGANLGPDDKQLALASPLARSGAPAPSTAPFHSTNSEPIFNRNPFDSITGPLIGKNIDLPDAAADTQGPDLSDPRNAPPCDGLKVLIIAASSDPEWSFAAFQIGSDPKTQLRRRGGEVGSKTVQFVGWDRVWLSGGSQLCQASMFAPPAAGAPTAAPAAPPPPENAGGPGGLNPEIKKGISRVSATEFNVDRGVVDKILENQADLMRQARIVPEQENGKMVGIRLFGVRPETLLGVLGMENGDRLQTINGFDMTSPEKALEAYARLRTADHLTVQVNRKGSNTNLDYNIK